MAFDINDKDKCAKLSKAIKLSFERGAWERENRADLKRIYEDKDLITDRILNDRSRMAYLNLFSLWVRGHLINLAYRAPRWACNAQTPKGKGFDKIAQMFLEQYGSYLNIPSLVQRWALDSAFGRAVAKVCTSIAPKGITAPVAPRCFRINPDYYIPDRSSPHAEEMGYACDIYFADLDEARNHEGFTTARADLAAWRSTSSSNVHAGQQQANGDYDLFATDQTRLIDVFIPTAGKIFTWPCSSDSFTEIGTMKPLQELETPVNPYVQLDLEFIPDSLNEISRLAQLRPLNMLANDMYTKAANQAKNSQITPIAQVGDEMEMDAMLSRPDGEPAFLNNTKAVDVFNLPGPNSAIIGMANDAAGKFSEHGGNLNVGLGISPGASTARQTNALIGQINQAQMVDRMYFERFLGEIGKRILTLAFEDEALELTYAHRLPGMQSYVNAGWGPKSKIGRVGQIDDYIIEVVPYSTAFRGPQERLGQLQQASQLVFSAMQQKAMGAPINIEAVLNDAAESFDLVPQLQEWWTGQEPSPQQKAGQVYQSMAGPSQGSDVNYNSNSAAGNGGSPQFAEQPAGLASQGASM